MLRSFGAAVLFHGWPLCILWLAGTHVALYGKTKCGKCLWSGIRKIAAASTHTRSHTLLYANDARRQVAALIMS